MDYRSLPRYANSDLTEYRNQLFSTKPEKSFQAAQVFGTLFHALLLEGSEPQAIPQATRKPLYAMRDSVCQNRFASKVLETGLVEQVWLWDDPQTGLPCKCQTDIWVEATELIVDVKTTSARGYGEFLSACEQYAYDRQAAFYLDGVAKASRFVLLGVQKKAPYEVFYFEASATRGCIEGGRKKYQRLLKGIQRSGFVPSSWKAQLVS
ncbi:hypothetical protein GCM10023189_32730 [Nibrella saemangeumensis]|uniref:Putative exodeoxyribonuclease 8 PDDEXK-like domain-containing protein n=1 Tax=Nibrella saemangeumensis TaxID=1084526 RepID=A0ABP8N4L7_9BACT